MRGNGLQAVYMNGILPVVHLEFVEARCFAYDGVWSVIQRVEVRIVAVAADQNAFRGMQRVRDVLRGCRWCRVFWDRNCNQ